jgi:hypothetical protein
MTTTYVTWGQSLVKLTWTATQPTPQPELKTSVHGLCFHENQLLLVDIKNRGWHFPGGLGISRKMNLLWNVSSVSNGRRLCGGRLFLSWIRRSRP